MNIRDEVRDVIREELGLPSGLPLLADAELYSLGADSLDLVACLIGLENHFGIDIDTNVIGQEKNHTVGWLIRLVEERLST
jgi:acyl carrier protein